MCKYCWGKGYVLVATGINGGTIEVQCPKCQPECDLPAEKIKNKLLMRFKRRNGKNHQNVSGR